MQIKKDIFDITDEFQFDIYTSIITKSINEFELIYHWHDTFEISYIISGEGIYFVEDQIYEMKPGDIIIFNNTEVHSWRSVNHETMKLQSFVFFPEIICNSPNIFDNKYLAPFLQRGANFRNNICANEKINHKIVECLIQINDEFNIKKFGYEMIIKAKLLEIMAHLVRFYNYNVNNSIYIHEEDTNYEIISIVIDYIKNNYHKEISLKKIASIACMSQNYFCTYFKKIIGISFVEYLSMIRLNAVTKLLQNPNLKLSDIAFNCGFSSISNFNRIFKKHYTKTPTEFRFEMNVTKHI